MRSFRTGRSSGDQIFVSYVRKLKTEIVIFDSRGQHGSGTLPVETSKTVRFVGGFGDMDELLFERESFVEPIQILQLLAKDAAR